MAFNRIQGQDQAARTFAAVISTGRLAHAYLLLGPLGVGKAFFAGELAKAVLCRQPKPDACEVCDSCRRYDAGRHADFHVVTPAQGKRYVTIDQIKALQEAISIKAVEGGYKVFVVDGADNMTPEAANAFLKTLEEPPPRSLLVLTAATLETLPDTIVSRCQIVRFRPLPATLIARLLAEQHNVPADQAAAIAQFAGGSMGRAVALTQGQAEEWREWVKQEGSGITPDRAFDLAEDMLSRTRKKSGPLEDTRARLREFLSLLMLYCRDLLMMRLEAQSQLPAGSITLFNSDLRADPQAVAWTTPRLERAVSRILEALVQLEMNVNVTLIVEGLFIDLAHGTRHAQSPAS